MAKRATRQEMIDFLEEQILELKIARMEVRLRRMRVLKKMRRRFFAFRCDFKFNGRVAWMLKWMLELEQSLSDASFRNKLPQLLEMIDGLEAIFQVKKKRLKNGEDITFRGSWIPR